MPEFLTPGVFLQGGAVGILAIVVWMVYTGKLVSRSVLDDVRKDRDDRLNDMRGITQTWQQAYITSEAARQEALRQVSQLLEIGRIAEALLRAMPHPETREAREISTGPGGNST